MRRAPESPARLVSLRCRGRERDVGWAHLQLVEAEIALPDAAIGGATPGGSRVSCGRLSSQVTLLHGSANDLEKGDQQPDSHQQQGTGRDRVPPRARPQRPGARIRTGEGRRQLERFEDGHRCAIEGGRARASAEEQTLLARRPPVCVAVHIGLVNARPSTDERVPAAREARVAPTASRPSAADGRAAAPWSIAAPRRLQSPASGWCCSLGSDHVGRTARNHRPHRSPGRSSLCMTGALIGWPAHASRPRRTVPVPTTCSRCRPGPKSGADPAHPGNPRCGATRRS